MIRKTIGKSVSMIVCWRFGIIQKDLIRKKEISKLFCVPLQNTKRLIFFNCFIKFCSVIFTYLSSISYCIQYFYLPVYLLLRIGNEKSVHFYLFFLYVLRKVKEKHQLIRFFSLLRSYHNDQGGFLYEKQTNFFTSFIICILSGSTNLYHLI